jgi:hypothetical protein
METQLTFKGMASPTLKRTNRSRQLCVIVIQIETNITENIHSYILLLLGIFLGFPLPSRVLDGVIHHIIKGNDDDSYDS